MIELSEEERTQLREAVRRTRSTRELRRAQALLELDQGTDVLTVARRQAVGRSTVYDWVHRFIERRTQPISQRLRDLPRPGRPDQKRQAVKELVHSVIKTDPRQLGYRYPVWTTPLLRHHLERAKGVRVSKATVRRALRDLRHRYKRPRYVLSRRAPHWRQAKGG